MKTVSLATRPSLRCQLVRARASLFGSDTPSGASGARRGHICSCASCQEYFAAGDELDSALKREAVRQAAVPSDGFNDRILQAVRRSQRTARPSHTHWGIFSLLGTTLAAAAAVVFLLKTPTAQKAPALAGTPPSVTDVMFAAESLSGRLWDSIRPSAVALTSTNPLQDELDSVYSDARNALGFLALNFLPASLESALPEAEDAASMQRS